MCLSLTPMKQRSDYVYLVSFPIVKHNVSLCKVRNTFLSFLSFRTKCSSLRYMGERQHPRDEILGAELKGKDVSWNISGRNIKPRREENRNGETGQCWSQEKLYCASCRRA